MLYIDSWKVKEMDFKKTQYWTKIRVQAFFIKLKVGVHKKQYDEPSEEEFDKMYEKIIEKINNEK